MTKAIAGVWLRSVDIHRIAITVAARWIIAAKLASVFS
jgi:hypothetical protein